MRRWIGLRGVVARVAEEGAAIENALLEIFEIEINRGRDVESDELRNDQAADDNESEWLTGRAVCAEAESDGQRAHERSESGHHDGAEARDAGFVDGVGIVHSLRDALLGEIDDHDSVFLDDAHQHEHADESVERSFCVEKPKSEQAADESHRQ